MRVGTSTALGQLVLIEHRGRRALVGQLIEASSDDESLPYDVTFVLRWDAEQRRFEMEQLRCVRRPGGPAVTGAGMRALPLGTLRAEAIQDAATAIEERDGQLVLESGESPDVRRLAYERQGRGRRPRIPDAMLPTVAATYQEGQQANRGIEAVRERFGVGRSTAHRAIQRASAAGLIG